MRTIKPQSGTCHICGRFDKLSREHVPPKQAFNRDKAYIYGVSEMLKRGEDHFPWELDGLKGGQQHQGGVGFYTLCGQCNNDTGAWYASAFVQFIHRGYAQWPTVESAPANNIVELTFADVYPLRIIKQVLAMFCSINQPELTLANPCFRELLLARESRGLDSNRYRLYMYANRGSLARYAGISSSGNLETHLIRVLTELSAPPFGFMLEFEPKFIDERFTDITFLANEFKYEEKKNLKLSIPVLETHMPLPGDFRSREQVMADYIKNKMSERVRQLQQCGHLNS